MLRTTAPSTTTSNNQQYEREKTMKSVRISKLIAVAAAITFPAVLWAQGETQVADNGMPVEVKAPASDTAKVTVEKKEVSKFMAMAPKIEIQNFRPFDMRGLNVYEAPKDQTPYTGFKLSWGAGFTQQFQGLDHSNTAAALTKKD